MAIDHCLVLRKGKAKLVFKSYSTRTRKIIILTGLWYFVSLVSLWINKFLLSTVIINPNILTMSQLGMSVICGSISYRWIQGFQRGDARKKFSLFSFSSSTMKLNILPIKIFSLLGSIRIVNTIFGLIALKYVPVSFTETIKSSAPFFTVFLTYLILGQKTAYIVVLSLVPIILGLLCASLAEISFSLTGFVAAILANCMDCVQNVLSKKYLTKSYTSTELHLYTSAYALFFQVGIVYIDLIINQSSYYDETVSDVLPERTLIIVLLFNGFLYYLQSIFAYMLMEMISPVAHSVTNTVKRAFLIVVSVQYFGNEVTPLNWFGTFLVLVGVAIYTKISNEIRGRDKMMKFNVHHVIV